MWGTFFGEFQCLPVDDCPTASCDSGVLAKGSESTSFYSAILVPPLASVFLLGRDHQTILLLSVYDALLIGRFTVHLLCAKHRAGNHLFSGERI